MQENQRKVDGKAKIDSAEAVQDNKVRLVERVAIKSTELLKSLEFIYKKMTYLFIQANRSYLPSDSRKVVMLPGPDHGGTTVPVLISPIF